MEEVVTINGKEYTMTEVMACHDFLEERYFIDEVQRSIDELIDANIGDDPEFISWLDSHKDSIIKGSFYMKDDWDNWRTEMLGETGANYVDYARNWILAMYQGGQLDENLRRYNP